MPELRQRKEGSRRGDSPRPRSLPKKKKNQNALFSSSSSSSSSSLKRFVVVEEEKGRKKDHDIFEIVSDILLKIFLKMVMTIVDTSDTFDAALVVSRPQVLQGLLLRCSSLSPWHTCGSDSMMTT